LIYIARRARQIFVDSVEFDRSITLVSSINAIKGYGLPAYSAAKAGMIGLVKGSVVELGRQNIRINAVLPGTVITPRTSKQPKDFEALKQGTALNRLTNSVEVSKAVAFVAIEAISMTGQELILDCGQSVKPCM
jgi:NAD(P)-dependent dehydrogenase (short-subunit alcohol dehydrogenase family)